MTDKIPQWVAFSISACMFFAAILLLRCYQDAHSTHTLVVGKAVSVESRTTRINANSTQKLFHLIASVPVEGEERTLILKEGDIRRSYKKGQDVTLIYPNGNVEDIRFLRSTEKMWPTMLALAIGAVALFAGIQFRREASAKPSQAPESGA